MHPSPIPLAEDAASGPAASLSPRPHWFAVDYALGPDTDALRAAVWRALKDLGAVNLKQRTWAVPMSDRPRQRRRLDDLARQIGAAGGRASVAEVGLDGAIDIELHTRLNRACERLWDDVANAADRLLVLRPDRTPRPVADVVSALAELRRLFVAATVRDIVRSDAGRITSRRLRALEDELAILEPDAGPPRERRVRIEVAATWELDGGDRQVVAIVDPMPDPRWDLAFRRFEERVLVPSATRVELCHGTFTWRCAPDAVDGSIDALTRRVRWFEQSVAAV